MLTGDLSNGERQAVVAALNGGKSRCWWPPASLSERASIARN